MRSAGALLAELMQALSDLHMQKSVRAVVLTGTGAAFCAGMDLGEMLATSKEPNSHTLWHEDAVNYRELVEAMLLFPKPLIAAVNGPAIAGGAGLVLACDLVLAADNAAFGLPEPLRGIVAGLVAPLLTFRLGGGLKRARLLMSAQTIDAKEAHRIGVFHELVHPDHFGPKPMRCASQ